ncbi:hypothetical protein AHiyo8_41040 [Arthrobacter sp. Hiyo8]|nr:hypothetical protein AHiyo8_41040 [Arthrobacter sp. Hiyo8]
MKAPVSGRASEGAAVEARRRAPGGERDGVGHGDGVEEGREALQLAQLEPAVSAARQVLLENPGLGSLESAEQVGAQQLVKSGFVHRCTPISSRIVRSALTA